MPAYKEPRLSADFSSHPYSLRGTAFHIRHLQLIQNTGEPTESNNKIESTRRWIIYRPRSRHRAGRPSYSLEL